MTISTNERAESAFKTRGVPTNGSAARLLACLVAVLLLACPASAQDILKELEGEGKPKPPDVAQPDPVPPQAEPESKPSAEVASAPEAAPPATDEKPGETESDDAEKSEFMKWLDGVTKSGPLGMIRKGGLFMWPILVLGILAAGVIIERFRSLRLLESDSGELRVSVGQLLHEDRVEEAFRLCDNSQGPVPAVLAAGLRKYLMLRKLNYDPAGTEKQVVEAMEDRSVHIVAALERHLPILATISSVAPMLGFLGTVSGMITSFDDIRAMFEGNGGGGQNIVLAAASGISVALITTCFGLIIGIPAFIAYNYFTGIINRFVLEVEESTTELIEGVTLQLAIAGSGKAGSASRSVAIPLGEVVP